MKRIAFIVLTFLSVANSAFAADAREQLKAWIAAKDLVHLGKVASRSPEVEHIWSKLGLFHEAVFTLNRIWRSKTESPELRAEAERILRAEFLGKNFNNYLYGKFPSQHPDKTVDKERFPYDLLLEGTAQLGEPGANVRYSVYEFVTHEDPKVRTASAIWLAAHFTSTRPANGMFPAQPEKILREVPGAELDEDLMGELGWLWIDSYVRHHSMASPVGKALARLSYNAEYDPSDEAKAASIHAWNIISHELKSANKPVTEPEMSENMIVGEIKATRYALANRLLNDINSIREVWSEMRNEMTNGSADGNVQHDELRAVARKLIGAPPLPFCESAMTTLNDLFKKKLE